MAISLLLLLHPLVIPDHLEAQTATPDGESASESEDAIVTKKDAVSLVEDANLDDAIQRRPDLDFANVTVDQEKSTINLSEIPAEAVEKAEVLKAVTPDLDADTRGGALVVTIKPVYDLEKSVLKGKLYTRYKYIYQEPGIIGTLTWAKKINKNAGFRITGGYQDIVKGSDTLRFDWSDFPAVSTGAYVLNRADMLNGYRTFKNYRLNGSFDLRLSPSVDLFFRASWDAIDIVGDSTAVQYRFGNEAEFDFLTADEGRTRAGRVRREGRFFQREEQNLSYTIGGTIKKPKLELAWRVQGVEKKIDDVFREVSRFEKNPTSLGYVDARNEYPRIIDPSSEEGSAYDLSGHEKTSGLDTLKSNNAALDLTFRPDWLSDGSYLKAGFKFSLNKNEVDTLTDVFSVVTDEPPKLERFVADRRRSNFIGQGYDHGITPDAASVSRYISENPHIVERDPLLSALRTDPATFGVDEEIYSGYFMGNFNLGRWRLLGGVRYEATNLSSEGSEVIVDGPDFEVSPRYGLNEYANFFANFHARYRWSDSLDVIASFTQTIKRPAFRDTAPFRIISTDFRTIVEGNPDARAMIFDNFDLAFDYKPNDEMLISWELFYRTVSDSLFTLSSIVSDGPFDGYRLNKLGNGGSSTLWGSKIFYEQSLGAFSPKLEPFFWRLAYTYSRSEADYPARPDEALPLTDTPEHELQAFLIYETDRLYIQLGVDLRSRNLWQISPLGPEKDVYFSNWRYFNLKVDYNLNKEWIIFLDWANLDRYYEELFEEGVSGRPFSYKDDPWRILAGFRFQI